jgi:hypothetical protein
MNNYNISPRKNQTYFRFYHVIIQWLKGFQLELKDPEHLLVKNKFTGSMHKIMNYILKLIGSFENVYVCQQTIARKIGISLRTVSRCLSLLFKIGLLSRTYRGANKTLLYFRGPLLLDSNIKFALKDIFPGLYWASESLALKCKNKFNALGGALLAVFNPFGVRLSNDKIKELNTSKKTNIHNQNTEEFIPSQDDIIRLDCYLEYEKRRKEEFSKEMALILGISPSSTMNIDVSI